MKVMFVGVGLVHYYNLVLNRLMDETGIDIVNVVATNQSGHVGNAVHQTRDGCRFRIVELPEHHIGARYHSFHGLAALILKERPAIAVVSDYYMPTFMLNPAAIRARRLTGMKLIMKSIPFRLKRYDDCLADWRQHSILFRMSPPGLVRRLLLEGLKFMFNIPDAHVNYVTEAYNIYGSYGIARDRIHITYNSPDTDTLLSVCDRIRTLPGPFPPNKQRLIHVGRLIEWKRVDLLLEAVQTLSTTFPNIELLIVGEGPERARLEALTDDLNIRNHVRFTGGIFDPDTLGQHLMASSVYVLAGMGGLSINDAMCFEKPVICSVCDGTERNLVTDNVNGFFFKEGDRVDLCDKITRILSDPLRMAEMGRASRQVIETRVNIHTVIDGYMKAFRYVMGTP